MDEEIEERSRKIIEMFNSAKGMDMEDFPAPPFSKWLNPKILSVERGSMTVDFKIRPEMANPTGLFHGGMQAALMDDLIGATTATLGYEGFTITIDLHVDFIGKAKVGEIVKAKTQITREGKRIIHAIAEITNDNGDVIATASSNLLRTTFKYLG